MELEFPTWKQNAHVTPISRSFMLKSLQLWQCSYRSFHYVLRFFSDQFPRESHTEKHDSYNTASQSKPQFLQLLA